MAITATAVSFRKGTKQEHERFTGGVQGEITVDTTDATVWVHLGDERAGTPLARADTQNINTADLVNPSVHSGLGGDGDKPLCYADLENVNITNVNTVRENLDILRYADENTNDINSVDLAMMSIYHPGYDQTDPLSSTFPNIQIPTSDIELAAWRENHNRPLAYWDGTNIKTAGLAERTNGSEEQTLFGKNLSYADLTNVEADTIANKLDTEVTDYTTYGYYSKSDFSNITTENLATGAGVSGHHRGNNLSYANLSNIETITDANAVHNAGVQITSLMTSNLIYTSSNQYPSTEAVSNAINDLEKIPNLPVLGEEQGLNLGGYFPYQYVISSFTGGRGYTKGAILQVGELQIHVLSTDDNGIILSSEIMTPYGIYTQGITGTFNATALSYVRTIVDSISIANVQVNIPVFENKTGNTTTRHDYEFYYNGAQWTLNNTAVNIFEYGISYTNYPEPVTNDTITVEYYPSNYNITTLATFTIGANNTGHSHENENQVLWNDKKYNPQIKDISIDEDTGTVTVTMSEIPKAIDAKDVLRDRIIAGSWSRLDTVMVFAPVNAQDILANAWIIKLQ